MIDANTTRTALYTIGGVAAGVTCLSVGFLFGIEHQRKFTMKRFDDSQPLLEKILVDLFAEAIKQGMSEEQFKEVVNTEMNFLRIVSE